MSEQYMLDMTATEKRDKEKRAFFFVSLLCLAEYVHVSTPDLLVE